MTLTYPSAVQAVSRRQPVARLGRVLLVSTLAAAVIACAPARKAAYPTPLFTSVPVDRSPSIVIKKDIDLVRLEGALASQEQVNLVAESASDLFGAEMIINSLVVDESLADADWLASALQTVNEMRDVEDFSLVAGSGHLVVGGSVDSYDRAEEISNIASDMAGQALAVSSTIAYPGDTAADNAEDIVVADIAEEAENIVAEDLVAAESATEAENIDVVEDMVVAESEVEAERVDLAQLADEAEPVIVVENPVEPENIFVADNTEVAEQVVVADNPSVVENPVSEPSLVPVEGVSVSLASLLVLEQQAVAVALEQPAAIPVAAVAVAPEQPLIIPTPDSEESLPAEPSVAEPVVTEDVVVVPASIKAPVVDTDGDGVADLNDECTSRSGYPVNNRGCQLLDGYLKDVHFYGATDQLTEDAMISLNNIADIMGSHPASKIAVLSYSQDGSPSEMRMQARERAYSVVDYLVGQGIDPARLQAFALSHRQGISEQILIKEVD